MQTLLRLLRGLIVAASLCYCLALFGLALLWRAGPQAAWWLALSNMFAPLLFAPLLLLPPLALALRSWAMGGAAAAGLALGLALFGGQLMPRAVAAPPGAPLRVMTFNHLFANPNVGQIIAEIRAQRADVVALQELSTGVAAAIERELRAEYPHQYLRPFDSPQGMGIISRLPIEDAKEIWEVVRGQQITLRVDGQPLTLINVHLGAPHVRGRRIAGLPLVTGYDDSSTTRQVGRLAQLIDQIAGPLVVLGDLNTGDREPRYQQLAARMHDAFRETNAGFGFTFPDHKRFGVLTIPLPLVRIDYVWSKGGILPAAAHVACNNTGADHCYLVAELRVTP